jgi:hypothetical protein
VCSLAGRYGNPIPTRFLAPPRLFKTSSTGFNNWFKKLVSNLAGLELDDVGREDLLEEGADVLLVLPEPDAVDEGAQHSRLLLRALVVPTQQLRQLLN